MDQDDTLGSATPNPTRIDPLIPVAANFYGLVDAKLSLGADAPFEWNSMLAALRSKVEVLGGAVKELDTPTGSFFIVHGKDGAILDRNLGVPHRERYLDSAAIARRAE